MFKSVQNTLSRQAESNRIKLEYTQAPEAGLTTPPGGGSAHAFGIEFYGIFFA
jgi:hypothetical protein